jgi:inorganic pyrophosphatase
MSVKLEPGREVDVLLPGRKTYKRVKVVRVRPFGMVDVTDPRNGGIRTVAVENIRTVHYKQKLRRDDAPS